ncbi:MULTISPECIES: hypothetical protein [unclassified Microcoleus]|uniref:hypothetical protein n=1 Tax=unclassified Microcoleus TaxID=2642155 RepID=UPI001E016302|nr:MULTISPECIES: hypothetical protein [unclassified Microcoleus]MCC3415321.1 hypothetical protein [Microcoleus sp. PH2017_02_FOX_O_A]MCC3437429.1 hypothetical protein [Microcoleus sp. PH2017_05_CCC_O_A]MCC3441259.1 hypothetical protein [Microcoleus sp. PH2017_03_ELD_O_A]MCC3466909.1 hypothetical protein [Microcoleus sp. PH2017_06_SFM_O_A]MCC3502561.1 hypothetical protein [Microcoleus sp. PH2017_19_SFW_U_A]MCC3511314.1 hypothetical protein [Microcoleus sp. PH2017_17_BER_D_A]MCC3574867.1 hypot
MSWCDRAVGDVELCRSTKKISESLDNDNMINIQRISGCLHKTLLASGFGKVRHAYLGSVTQPDFSQKPIKKFIFF